MSRVKRVIGKTRLSQLTKPEQLRLAQIEYLVSCMEYCRLVDLLGQLIRLQRFSLDPKHRVLVDADCKRLSGAVDWALRNRESAQLRIARMTGAPHSSRSLNELLLPEWRPKTKLYPWRLSLVLERRYGVSRPLQKTDLHGQHTLKKKS